MKIGFVTATNNNFGSHLQSYALHKYLKDNGISNEIIDFSKKKGLKQFLRVFNYPLLKLKLRYLYKELYCRFLWKEMHYNLQKRSVVFKNFRDRYFTFSEKYTGYEALVKAAQKYDAVILGSDQVWNPVNLGANFTTLNFVPEDTLTITYSPSFGVSKVPVNQIKKTRNYLKRINFISVREESGQKIIKELINRDVPVVCDPTILVNKSYWDEIKGEERIIKDKYILCYFLGHNRNHRSFAKRLKEKTGFKIASLLYINDFVKSDFQFADLKPFNIGPTEFVNLVSNAEYIITDSFHGTIFSILYEKSFFSFSRFSEKSKASTNSRIDLLLKKLGIPERKLTGLEDISSCLDYAINYPEVLQKLSEFRTYSRNYLTNALCEIENKSVKHD